MKRHTTRTYSFICLGHHYYSNPSPINFTRSSRSYHYTINRPKFKHLLFWPGRWGRSNFIPAPILILWAPRSLYSNPSWLRCHFTYRGPQYSKTWAIWHTGNNLCHNRDCSSRIYRLSTSHIYSWTWCGHPSIFYSGHHNHCCSNWN